MEENNDNGKEQSAEDKAKENVQDTQNAVKDGANLAKNIASQNYIGAVKDGLNLLKNKKVRRKIIISILTPIVTLVLIAGFIFAIFNAVGQAIETAIQEVNEWITNNYTFGIIYFGDEQLESIIDSIEATGISLDDLNLMGDIDYDEDDPEREEKERELLKKYLIKFLIAQEKMRVLNPRESGGIFEVDYLDNKIAQAMIGADILSNFDGQSLTYGNVYVYRVDNNVLTENNLYTLYQYVNSNTLQLEIQMEYLYYETFEEMVKNGDSRCLKYYTVDSEGNLVYANEVTTEIDKKGYWDKTSLNDYKLEKKYEMVSYNYRATVSPYVSSAQFFIYLTMITQNPEFSSALAEIAANGKIKLAIIDNYETTVETETNDYIMHFKKLEESEDEEDDEEEEVEAEEEYYDKKYHLETTTTTKTSNRKVALIYVDTWYAKKEFEYTRVEENEEGELQEDENPDEEEPSWDDMDIGDERHWMTDCKKTSKKDTKSVTYKQMGEANVIDKTDKVIEMLDTKYKIPNTTRREAPGENFVSGAEWLCELLKQDTYSQNMEQVIKYILNKYTNSNNYGDIELNDIIPGTASVDLSGEYFQEGGIQNEEQRQKIQEKIEKELLNTKVHSNYEYQNGPFAEWWTIPKNTGLLYQCPWWVYGRAQMYLETIGSPKNRNDLYKIYGNGADWYDKNIAEKQFNYGTVPKANSIISWKGGDQGYGHVAYVEGVTSDGIYISHAGSGKSWLGITKIGLDGNVGWNGYTLNGYIYLDEPIT